MECCWYVKVGVSYCFLDVLDEIVISQLVCWDIRPTTASLKPLIRRRRWANVSLFGYSRCYSPAGIFLLKVYNRNTRTRCKTCSKLTINSRLTNKSMTSFWCLYGELWTYFTPCSSVPIVNFKHVITGWVWTMFIWSGGIGSSSSLS